ncbi:hypothetical protein K1719_028600 [Acacia pycnantha]|nr:hypothetical protein K1719_028600 [Acacia pycnantha]
MLRFRPIVPKPTARSTISGSSLSESGDAFPNGGKQKRKYVKMVAPTTATSAIGGGSYRWNRMEIKNNGNNVTMWLNFEIENMSLGKVDPLVTPFWYPDQPPMRAVVTGSCVTETWAELQGQGGTDVERAVKLSKDMCPTFISDGYGRVMWTTEHKVAWWGRVVHWCE